MGNILEITSHLRESIILPGNGATVIGMGVAEVVPGSLGVGFVVPSAIVVEPDVLGRESIVIIVSSF